MLDPDGVYVYDDVNIAFAVDTDYGLLAPVVQQVDRLLLDDIAEYTSELISAAREGNLGEEQLKGGTFTISSLGTLGIDQFTPVINLPPSGNSGDWTDFRGAYRGKWTVGEWLYHVVEPYF